MNLATNVIHHSSGKHYYIPFGSPSHTVRSNNRLPKSFPSQYNQDLGKFIVYPPYIAHASPVRRTPRLSPQQYMNRYLRDVTKMKKYPYYIARATPRKRGKRA